MFIRNKHLRPISLRSHDVRPAWDLLEDRVVLSGSPVLQISTTQFSPVALLHNQGGNSAAGYNSPTGLGYTPAQVRTAYGINGITFGSLVGDGTGQTIAIVDAYDDPGMVSSSSPTFSTSDLAEFDATFGIPDPPSFTKYNQTGLTSTYPGTDSTGGWELEESLDVEWAHALAPMANIDLIESANAGNALYTAVATAANLPGVSVVSMSWGGSEASGEASTDSKYFVTPTGHLPVTFLASTGDSGKPGGYPADSPNVVAVGGTNLYLNSDSTYSSETGWVDSGGGISKYEPVPSYQTAVQAQDGYNNNGKRTIPDVSSDAAANTGVPVYDSFQESGGPWEGVEGTSFACPSWAALIALADQGRVAQGGTTLDGTSQTLPDLYALDVSSPGDYHDVTSGNNGYAARTGYDLVTGIGSPVANLLVPALASYGLPASNLVVTSVTPTASGFSVTFNKAINPANLSLYSTASEGSPPPAVTLVGASTGPVRGSLILSPNDQTITFVQTGGILTADTYTLTLTSAANGFVDDSGNPLAGGQNYTTTFTVAPTTARVIAIPDFARGPGQTVNVPATGSGLPITISDGTGVTSISETITYNPVLLTLTGVNLGSSAPAGASITLNTSTFGSAVLTFTSPTALPAGLDTFASLVASVPNAAPYTEKEALVIGGISINGGAVAGTDDDAVHVVAYVGNAAGSGVYSSSDVSQIQRVLVGLDGGFANYPLLDPTILADILGRGRLSSSDASILAQALVGFAEPLIPAVPHVTITHGADPLVYIPQDLTAMPGATLTVPVLFKQTNATAIDLDSTNVAIAFDPALFTVADVRLGNVPKGFLLGDSIDEATGVVLIWAHSAGGPITLQPGFAGTLFEIDLAVRPGVAPGAARINLLGGATVGNQVFSTSLDGGTLTLIPAPTNSDNDPVDGVVTIASPSLGSTLGAVAPIATAQPSAEVETGASPDPLPNPQAASSAAVDRAIASIFAESSLAKSFGLGDPLALAAPISASSLTLVPWLVSDQPGDISTSADDPVSLAPKKVTGRPVAISPMTPVAIGSLRRVRALGA